MIYIKTLLIIIVSAHASFYYTFLNFIIVSDNNLHESVRELYEYCY